VTVHLGPLLVEAADPAGARVLADYSTERFTLADVEALAARWAPLLGAEIGPGPDGTMRWPWSVAAGRDELVRAGASAEGDDLLVDPGGNEVSAPGRAKPAG
jgi:hypothetical protein